MLTNDWTGCKNILCIRPDNMGDLIMSSPAIRALKKTLAARITVLTSSMATPVARLIEDIDDVITFDMPWVKNSIVPDTSDITAIVQILKEHRFDAAVVFTVYSQNPLPAVMLAYLADIPRRLAYCRENPYQLLTEWVPDKEPYEFIRHQVRRDLDLVAAVGAFASDETLSLSVDKNLVPSVQSKLAQRGLDIHKKWLILHAGVSEVKRQYPLHEWVLAGKRIIEELQYQVVLTGSSSEQDLTQQLITEIGAGSVDAGGLFDLNELLVLIGQAGCMISVNTGTIHLAAALQTPVVVLYALTNPQHTPWKSPCKVLPYQVPDELHSRNEVVRYVNRFFYKEPLNMPDATDIVCAVKELLLNNIDGQCNLAVMGRMEETDGFIKY